MIGGTKDTFLSVVPPGEPERGPRGPYLEDAVGDGALHEEVGGRHEEGGGETPVL